VRIGVATSDPDAILATPVETVRREHRSHKHLRRLVELVVQYEVVEVVVGLPRTLADRTGPAARDALDVADMLAKRIAPTPVRMVDERLTTVTAQRSLREAGVRARGQRAMVDQVAAVGILQSWLDQRRAALSARGEGADG
jgi:putative Holliday junction resolvase